jgi:hypothetical protein
MCGRPGGKEKKFPREATKDPELLAEKRDLFSGLELCSGKVLQKVGRREKTRETFA